MNVYLEDQSLLMMEKSIPSTGGVHNDGEIFVGWKVSSDGIFDFIESPDFCSAFKFMKS